MLGTQPQHPHPAVRKSRVPHKRLPAVMFLQWPHALSCSEGQKRKISSSQPNSSSQGAGNLLHTEQGAPPFAQPSLIPQQTAPRATSTMSYSICKVSALSIPQHFPVPAMQNSSPPSHWLLQYSSIWHETQGQA